MEEGHHSPQKRKRTTERARVTRACDRCKRRKVKCDGRQPCQICSKVDASCTFDTTYSRGTAPPIPQAPAQGSQIVPNDGATAIQAAGGATIGPDLLNGAVYQPHTGNHSTCHAPPMASPSVAASNHKSPADSQTAGGLHGQYIGPASGVSFLQRVQNRLGQAVSFSHPDSIFTFGDRPLVKSEADMFMIPREEAQRLLDRYFDFAMPTYRFLHQPTIQAWFGEFYETFGVMRDASTAPAKVALLLMVLAHGRVYMPDDEKPGPSDLSNRLYLAAEQQLQKESGPIRLASIQSRLTQCFYLLTQSRINHCWSLFGTVSHLALATGLNRSRRSDSQSGVNHIEVECRRRSFWCAYTLDVYLSIVLGRPQLFHDADIDTELPTCIEDKELTENHAGPPAYVGGPSIMLAVLAQFSLARIVKSILRELLDPLRPIASSHRTVLTQRYSQELHDWRNNLATFLDADNVSASWLLPIFQRQRNVLNLTYWHAIILTHRPFLLSNFAAGSRQSNAAGDNDIETDSQQVADSVQQCLTAAMSTVNTINDMMRTRQISRVFWTAAYFAFTASIVLYIHVLQNRKPALTHHNDYLSAATLCQSHISSLADKGSLPERYCLLLEELRSETVRTRSDHQTPNPATQTTTQQQQQQQTTFAPPQQQQQQAPADFATFFPPSATGEVQGTVEDWGQFADMVALGLGNLDGFLNEDFLL
ncbi:hypothetical protein MBLNU230_g8218t1 [Neophaeotheca triangularis]